MVRAVDLGPAARHRVDGGPQHGHAVRGVAAWGHGGPGKIILSLIPISIQHLAARAAQAVDLLAVKYRKIRVASYLGTMKKILQYLSLQKLVHVSVLGSYSVNIDPSCEL